MKVINRVDFIAQLEVKDSKKELALNDLDEGDIFKWAEGGRYLYVKLEQSTLLKPDKGYTAIFCPETGRVYQESTSLEVVKVDCTLVIE